MTHHVSKSLRVNVPSEKIWEVLNDFSSVERFATTIKSSPIVGDKKSGLGAKRLCTFENDSSLVEEIIDYQEGRSIKVEISDFALPLKSMHAEMGVEKIDANSSEIFWSADFVVKWGPIGWLLGFLAMRPVMKGVFTKLLSGLAYHAATGEALGSALPSEDQLKLAIGS